MDDNPEIRDRLNVNKSTYHNKRPRERFICFIRGAKWTKINQLNGPSPIHDTSTWLSQSIQSIRNVCCWLDMQKNLPWKCFRTAFGHYDFPSTRASQQVWRMRKRYHLLLFYYGKCQRFSCLTIHFPNKRNLFHSNCLICFRKITGLSWYTAIFIQPRFRVDWKKSCRSDNSHLRSQIFHDITETRWHLLILHFHCKYRPWALNIHSL